MAELTGWPKLATLKRLIVIKKDECNWKPIISSGKAPAVAASAPTLPKQSQPTYTPKLLEQQNFSVRDGQTPTNSLAMSQYGTSAVSSGAFKPVGVGFNKGAFVKV
eukprot:SAG31_NODE_1958_length_6814_cov_3.386597_3_plen_106_part_00